MERLKEPGEKMLDSASRMASFESMAILFCSHILNSEKHKELNSMVL